MRLKEYIFELNDKLGQVEMLISVILFWGIILISVLQIVMRYFLTMPFIWAEELTVFMLLWIIFLGSASIYKKKGHVQIDLIMDMLPYRRKTILYIVIEVILLTILIKILYVSFNFLLTQMNVLSPALKIPRGFYTLSFTWCVFSMLLTSILNIYIKYKKLVSKK